MEGSKRREILRLGVGLTAGICGLRAEAKRPNILLIVADDHGWNDLGCYGHPFIKTPNLDRVSREGARFTRAFSTAPLCSPGRSGIVTGQYPHTNGVTKLVQGENAKQYALDPAKWTIAQGLSGIGYECAAAAKWHLSSSPKSHGFRHAFSNPRTYLADCAGFLDRAHNEPWFLYFYPTQTHRPFVRYSQFPYTPDQSATALPPYLKDTPQVREHYARYLSGASEMDREIGELLAAIERRKEMDNTVIVYCTDHGPSMHRAKFSLYEWGTHSSLLIRAPA